MELSKRLQTVANAVTPGSRVADVGTDHGYVPIYLVERGLCPGAIAMDVNEGPLARAEEHIRAEGLSDRIQTRKSDGLAALAPEETDAVVIAGMGGALMCRILQDATAFLEAGRELILQPQSEWFKVRRLLSASGYRITQEWFLEEEGKYYVVIKAGPARGLTGRAERGPSRRTLRVMPEAMLRTPLRMMPGAMLQTPLRMMPGAMLRTAPQVTPEIVLRMILPAGTAPSFWTEETLF